MSIYRQRKPNHLTRDNFELLLAALHPERERAAAQYEQLRRALYAFFEIRGSATPAEDADETFDRVARRLNEGREIFAANPRSYFYAVARNVWREKLASPHTEIELDESATYDRHRPLTPQEMLEKYEEHRAQEKRLACLSRCLMKLNASERALIEAYYQGSGRDKIQNRAALANRLGIPPNALRLRAMRLREKLEVCVTRCLKK